MKTTGKSLLALSLLAIIANTPGCNTVKPINLVSQRTPGFSQQPSTQKTDDWSHSSIQTASYTSVTAPLITLGPSDEFHTLIEQADGPVLVDFYADWCGPCRRQGKILHEMENTASQNHASIIKVNIDQHQQLASSYQVQRLPTVLLFKNGQIIDRQVGFVDRDQVASMLSR